MNVEFSPQELAFQLEVREFLAEKLPQDISEKAKQDLHFEKNDFVRWQQILASKGWAALNWPVEYGGTGWSSTQKKN